MAGVERVSFLGLGIMGSRQAKNLEQAGFELTVYNRTRRRADEFAEKARAKVASTPAEAVANADVAITMVVDVADVEEVLFGENGAAQAMKPGSLAIDMSTISASAARAIGARLAQRGIGFCDAPVTGSAPRAQDGTLTIMVGGEREHFDRARPVLDAMGSLVVHMGGPGDGQMTKLLQNTVGAINMAAIGQALGMAKEAGLDAEKLVTVLSSSTAASAALDAKAEPMLRGEYAPSFKLGHMLKDLRHTLAAARELDARAELAQTTEHLFSEVASVDHADDDVSAIALAGGRNGEDNRR